MSEQKSDKLILNETVSEKTENISKLIKDKGDKIAEKNVDKKVVEKLDEKIESLTGKRQVNVNKVFISDFNAAPGLAYVDLKISPLNCLSPENRIEIRALHDSGCAKSIIKTSVFNDLQKRGVIKIINPPQKMSIVSCTGEQQSITGLADIMLHFEGDHGVEMSFELNVIIHPTLSQDFLLGRDFTGSDAKAFETNSHLVLTDTYSVYWEPVRMQRKNKSLCFVPIVRARFAPMHVATNQLTIIPPFSSVQVTCTLQKSDTKSYQLPLETNGKTTFEVVNSLIPRIKTLPMASEYDATNNIVIPLCNPTHEDIVIEQGEHVAEIDIWREEMEVHHMMVYPDLANVIIHPANHAYFQSAEHDLGLSEKEKEDAFMDYMRFGKEIEIPTNHARPAFIEEDLGLNEDEKEKAFQDYMKKGYHHPSMTKVVEDRAAMTELYLKSTVPVPDHLFETQFDVKHLPPKIQQMALEIFRAHKEAFSKHAADLGCSKDIEMKIPLKSNEPHIQKYIPIPHACREQVRAVLDQYLEFDIIRECDEPSMFCSNLLVVKKKDGKNIRIILDGRLLNFYTLRQPAQCISSHEVLNHLVGATIVTTIDLSDSFFQMLLHPDSQPLTAFYSEAHGKRYCFKRCPQGLRNSPLHLKLLMDKLFGDMATEVIHYVDDILIATNGSLKHHLKVVEKVLQRMKEGNIKIRPSKITLAQNRVEFLGIVWTAGKISIPEGKLLAFKTLSSPTTPKKAKSVICCLAYYRRFIANFAALARPIMELGSLHPKCFKWTEALEKCFRKIINLLCKNAILYLPDPKKPYYIQTDASQYAGAGRVFQKDDEGNEKVIACISRTFSKSERSYSTIRKEVLALLYTLKTMDFFLRHAEKVIILVDAQAILFLRLCRESSGLLLRFSIELSNYDVEIHHVKGENNEVADILSRHHTDIDEIFKNEKITKCLSEKQTIDILRRLRMPTNEIFTKEEVAHMLEADSLPAPEEVKKKKSTAKDGIREVKNTPKTLHNRKIKMPKEVKHAPGAKLPSFSADLKSIKIESNQAEYLSYGDFRTVSQAVLTGTLTKEQFKLAQLEDPFCSKTFKKWRQLKRFTVIGGLLFFKSFTSIKLVLPVSLLDMVINAKHFSLFGLHFSKTRIQRDIIARYFVQQSELNRRLNLLKNNCLLCQFNTSGKQDQELRATDYIFSPGCTWAIDLIPNMPLTADGHKAILVAVDLFTGYIQLYPLKEKSTSALIEAVERSIFSSFGIPKYLRSDEEPGLFSSKEFFEYLKPLGIKYLPTSVGSPWANGHAERSIRTIKEAARAFLQQEKIVDKWDKHLLFFHEAHNNSTSVYGYAPHQLMFAYTKPMPSDLLQFWPNVRDPSEYMEKIVPYAEKIRDLHMQRSDKTKGRNRTYKNQSRVKKIFQLGDLVAHKQLQLATGAAMGMKPRHTGPYIIVAFDDDQISATIEHLHTGVQIKAHFSNLSLVSFHPKANRVQAEFDNEIYDMIDLIDHNSTLYPKEKRPVNIPIDHLDDTPLDSVRATFIEDTDSNEENQNQNLHLINRNLPDGANRYSANVETDDNAAEQENRGAINRRKEIRGADYNPWDDSESSEGEIEVEEDSSTFLEISKNTRVVRVPTPYPGMDPEPEPDPDDPDPGEEPEPSDDPDEPE